MSHTPTDLIVRPLLPADLPDALALTREAGWNHLPADWERLMALAPEGCFALECNGRLAATTTVVCYGTELAWIGMVLTAQEFRRRGFAELLMRKALAFVEHHGVAAVKLDATDAGVNLYRKLGFAQECTVERWQRPPSSVGAVAVLPYRPDPDFDRATFGANRTALLTHLAEIGSASLLGKGYAMGRPGALAAYFGPCVASSAEVARTLLRWFLAQHPQENVFWDVLPSNAKAVCLAREFGFAPARHLVRMVHSNSSSPPPYSYTEQFAISGLEFG